MSKFCNLIVSRLIWITQKSKFIWSLQLIYMDRKSSPEYNIGLDHRHYFQECTLWGKFDHSQTAIPFSSVYSMWREYFSKICLLKLWCVLQSIKNKNSRPSPGNRNMFHVRKWDSSDFFLVPEPIGGDIGIFHKSQGIYYIEGESSEFFPSSRA